jgi:drug/metabolite transporter (DMT)-like permease
MKLRGIWLDLAASAVGGLGIAIIWILGGILFQEDTMTDSVGVFIVFAVGFLFNLLIILPARRRRGTWPPKQ